MPQGCFSRLKALWQESFSAGHELPQLAVLFLGFCALQIAAFTVARRIWQRRVYGYIALGLILSETTLWHGKGVDCSISGWISWPIASMEFGPAGYSARDFSLIAPGRWDADCSVPSLF